MALEAYPVVHFMKVMDADGNTFDLRYNSNGFSTSTADGLNDQWASDFANVSTLRIVERGWTFRQVESDQTPVEALGQGEKKAQITIDLVRSDPGDPGQTKSSNVYIPGPKPEIFLALAGPGATIVDQNNADVVAYLNNYYYGLGVLPCLTLSDFQTALDPSVVANWEGKKITRKSKKG